MNSGGYVEENNVDRRGRNDVRRLTDLKCWPEVQQRIRSGEKSGSIAKWIQSEAKELLGIKVDSVRRSVARERELMAVGDSLPEQKKAREEIEKLRKDVEEARESDVTDKSKKRKILDILDEVGELYELQMERVRAGRKVEVTMGYLIRTMTADVAEAREILKFALEVQSDMGLSKRPREESVEGGKRFESLTYEGRRRVLQAIDMVKRKLRVMEIEEKKVDVASGEVIEAEVVGGGSGDGPNSTQDGGGSGGFGGSDDAPDGEGSASDSDSGKVSGSDSDSGGSVLGSASDSQGSADGLPFE